MDEELELETSPLSQDLSDGGKTVEVQIYRGGGSDWILEGVTNFVCWAIMFRGGHHGTTDTTQD